MSNIQNYSYFTKEDVENIKDVISLHCHWNDKVMNKVEDFFSFMEIPEGQVVEIQSTLVPIEKPAAMLGEAFYILGQQLAKQNKKS